MPAVRFRLKARQVRIRTLADQLVPVRTFVTPLQSVVGEPLSLRGAYPCFAMIPSLAARRMTAPQARSSGGGGTKVSAAETRSSPVNRRPGAQLTRNWYAFALQ